MEFKDILERLESQYRKLYVARVTPDIVSDLVVKAYDSDMKLSELANITVPSARVLIIKPYDESCMEEIVKAFRKQKPEFVPVVQSDHIRISLNPPTEETRKKVVKEAKELLEQSKISVRNLRKTLIDELKNDDLSEDLRKKEINKIDQDVKSMNSKLDSVFAAKEKEIITI